MQLAMRWLRWKLSFDITDSLLSLYTYRQPPVQMPAARKRQRSATPPPSPSLPAAPPGPSRSVAEWEKLEDGSVLMLPPTTPIVLKATHALVDTPHALAVKIAAFDMDDTVITPASGGVFPKDDDPADWQWLHPAVPVRLRRLHDAGFMVVLFSNQMGIGKGGKWNAAKAAAIESKVVQLSVDLAVPLCACVATRDDTWRKPSPRIWHCLEARVRQCLHSSAELGGGGGGGGAASAPSMAVVVDCALYSFYVGDAAGRATPTLAGRKKDFSCSDRQFAYNVQLPFFTPEQFFVEAGGDVLEPDATSTAVVKASDAPSFQLSASLLRLLKASATASTFSWGDVSPAELQALPKSYAQLPIKVITAAAVTQAFLLPDTAPFFARPQQQEMVLFVGFPGCGKSSFYRRHFESYGYCHVSRDALQTRAKCLKAAADHWAEGRSVVVDNTSPTAEDRQGYIDIVAGKRKNDTARAAQGVLPVRIFFFTHSRGMASHMNAVRASVEGAHRVPAIAFNVYQSKLQRVETAEQVAALGIEAVWEIPPVACFDGAAAETEAAFYRLT